MDVQSKKELIGARVGRICNCSQYIVTKSRATLRGLAIAIAAGVLPGLRISYSGCSLLLCFAHLNSLRAISLRCLHLVGIRFVDDQTASFSSLRRPSLAQLCIRVRGFGLFSSCLNPRLFRLLLVLFYCPVEQNSNKFRDAIITFTLSKFLEHSVLIRP